MSQSDYLPPGPAASAIPSVPMPTNGDAVDVSTSIRAVLGTRAGTSEFGVDNFTGAVMCSAASGGIGLSTLCAMSAWHGIQLGLSCALMDADFHAAGLDVLLGIEHEQGMRFGSVKAPLGHIDAESLDHELPQWEHVRVLAHQPWNAPNPQDWEVQAALKALCEMNDIVFIDAGDARIAERIPSLAQIPQLVACELSVLGLARTSAHVRRIAAARSQRNPQGFSASSQCKVVGIHPKAGGRRIQVVTPTEAGEYLGLEVIGPVRCEDAVNRDLLSGLGIRSIPRGSRGAVERIDAWLQHMLDGHFEDRAGRVGVRGE